MAVLQPTKLNADLEAINTKPLGANSQMQYEDEFIDVINHKVITKQ